MVDVDSMDLPPGFRFHPSDEELITYYLSPKVIDHSFCALAVGEVDLNKCEPWDLPRRAKMGEKELYFFVVKDRKYPTGMRTNRATEAGYWKATGKDKEIYKGKALVGMKKTLVFYKGRAPRGEKSNWVMHEYRLEGITSLDNLPSNTKNEWVICRIFHKNAAGKKLPFPFPNSNSGILPPLTESTAARVGGYTKHTPTPPPTHVSCFSNNNHYSGELGFTKNYPFSSVPLTDNPSDYFLGNYVLSEQNMFRVMLENQETEIKQSMKTERINYSASQDTCLSSDVNAEISSIVSNFYVGSTQFDDPNDPSTSGGLFDFDGFLNFR